MGFSTKYGVSTPDRRWYTLRTLAALEDTQIDALPYQLVSYTQPISPGSQCYLPAGSAALNGKYVGVQINGAAASTSGAPVEVVNSTGSVSYEFLYCEGQTVWFGYDHTVGDWEIVAREENAPQFSARFTPFAAYSLTGLDADLTDLSGNGRTLTKTGTPNVATNGLHAGDMAGVFGLGQGWSRTDAAFRLTDALSMELVVKPAGNALTGVGGFYVQFGSGSGGAANNRVYSVQLNALTAALSLLRTGWAFTSQHGANVNDTVNANTGTTPLWTHVVFTRTAIAGGLQTVKAYVNGTLRNTVSITANDSSTATVFTLGTALNGDGRFYAMWDSILTDAQIAYLARFRLGRLFRT